MLLNIAEILSFKTVMFYHVESRYAGVFFKKTRHDVPCFSFVPVMTRNYLKRAGISGSFCQ
jgi:hypothetical protein